MSPVASPSRIAIVGPGAIGGTLAAHLAARSPHDVTLCLRTPLPSLTVDTPSGPISASPRSTTLPSDVGPVSWVLLATKAHQTEGARPWLETLCGSQPGVTVAVLQNGVEHEQRVRPLLQGLQGLQGAHDVTIVPVVVQCAADRLEPGRVRLRGEPRLVVRDDAPGRSLRDLFAGTGVQVECTADFVTAAWKKLCANAVGGALTVLMRRPMGVLREPGMADLARAMVREMVQVARAEGAVIEATFADELVDRMLAGPPDASPSILRDALAGRPLEHDARNAVIPRIAARHGIAVPLNAMAARVMGAVGS